MGEQQLEALYVRDPRYSGESKWYFWRLGNFAVVGIVSVSATPLKVWSYVGITFAMLSFLYGSYLFLRTVLFGIDVPGYASLMVAVLFLGGVQMVSLGILGEYLGRVYEDVKDRPLYLVRDTYGVEQRPVDSRKDPNGEISR